MWRSVTCPFCGERYRDFRAPDQLSFVEAYDEVLLESRMYCAQGNYSRPASRRAVLGRMHEVKRRAWAEHIYWCEMEHPPLTADERMAVAGHVEAYVASVWGETGEEHRRFVARLQGRPTPLSTMRTLVHEESCTSTERACAA